MSSIASTHSADKSATMPGSPGDVTKTRDPHADFNPKDPKFMLIMLGIFFAIFLVGLDKIIISVAIPAITNEFDSIEDIGWYGSGYLLTTSILLPIMGRVYRQYSVKWVLFSSIVVFEVGSALCGAAPSSAAFIVGRAIAGMGSAGIFNGGMNVITQLVPLSKRPMFTAFFGIFTAVASILGPLVGGIFTDTPRLTWRWCFYINLPIGAFTLIVIFFFLHVESPPRPKQSILTQIKNLDALGALFLTPSMISLILALQWGGAAYAWSAPRVIGLLVCFAVTFIIFIVIEVMTPETAMAPMRVILDRSVAGAIGYMFIFSGAFTMCIYYLAIWFQAAQGTSAKEAGIRTIPTLMAFVIFGIVAGISTQKLGYYMPALLSSPIFMATGCGMLSTLVPSSGKGAYIGYQILFGVGVGFGFQTATLVPQAVLNKTDVPMGMAIVFFAKEFGGAIFFAVGQNVFTTRLVSRLSGIAGLDAEAILNTGATNLRNMVPAEELGAVVDSYSYALTRVFLVSAIMAALTILAAAPIKWTSIKKDEKKGDVEKVEKTLEPEKVEA